MRMHLIHLSDIHYKANKAEGLGVVLEELFLDIKNQMTELDKSQCYIVVSGDIVRQVAKAINSLHSMVFWDGLLAN